MMPQMSLYSDQVRNRGALSGMQMTPGSCSNQPDIHDSFTINTIMCIKWPYLALDRHLLLLSLKADTHFTVPQRVEG